MRIAIYTPKTPDDGHDAALWPHGGRPYSPECPRCRQARAMHGHITYIVGRLFPSLGFRGDSQRDDLDFVWVVH